jgi:nitrate reductase gamma subunit
MANADVIFQAHVATAWLLFAVWPFTRLVHVWSIPIAYVMRSPILYRSRARISPGAMTESDRA